MTPARDRRTLGWHRERGRLGEELCTAPKWQPVESRRALAARLDVSGTTVSQAMRMLADRGIIAKHNGMYYVS